MGWVVVDGVVVDSAWSGTTRATISAATPASAVTSQPRPPRSSGTLSAATTAATSSAMMVARDAGRIGPGQRLPNTDGSAHGPCNGACTATG
ncbi:hypothetical protein [Actinoplanes sp. ATCC 53533]|uniref:hypothetical protein n=1 Tax=Actinoplanes sp. ATCC 53533 TaxID=1288362 RepID=UPI001F32D8F1|nr:hypothetical protein [Actinoplanes sp. ATCC 53533]